MLKEEIAAPPFRARTRWTSGEVRGLMMRTSRSSITLLTTARVGGTPLPAVQVNTVPVAFLIIFPYIAPSATQRMFLSLDGKDEEHVDNVWLIYLLSSWFLPHVLDSVSDFVSFFRFR